MLVATNECVFVLLCDHCIVDLQAIWHEDLPEEISSPHWLLGTVIEELVTRTTTENDQEQQAEGKKLMVCV